MSPIALVQSTSLLWAKYKGLVWASAAAAALALAFYFGHRSGSASVQTRWEREVAAARAAQLSELVRRGIDNYKVDMIFQAEADDVRSVTQELLIQVPGRLPSSATCPELPIDFGLLHDAAARGSLDGLPASQLHEAGPATGDNQQTR